MSLSLLPEARGRTRVSRYKGALVTTCRWPTSWHDNADILQSERSDAAWFLHPHNTVAQARDGHHTTASRRCRSGSVWGGGAHNICWRENEKTDIIEILTQHLTVLFMQCTCMYIYLLALWGYSCILLTLESNFIHLTTLTKNCPRLQARWANECTVLVYWP